MKADPDWSQPEQLEGQVPAPAYALPGVVGPRRSWDLGQFERFRRLARDKPYDVLLQHIEHRVTSSLQVCCCQGNVRAFFQSPHAAS